MNIDSLVMMFTLNYDKFQNNLSSIYVLALMGLVKYLIDNIYYIRAIATKLYNKALYKTSVEMAIRIEYNSKYGEYVTVCSEYSTALLWEYLSNKQIANQKSNLKEFPINMDIKQRPDSKNNFFEYYMLAIGDRPIEIYKDIYIYFISKKDKETNIGRKNNGKYIEDNYNTQENTKETTYITLYLVSKYNNASYIENYIDIVYKRYREWSIDISHSLTRIYFTNEKKLYRYNFNSTKSFKNLFFDGKEQILNRLDFYMNHADEYKRLGIPHTLGLMFYGEPGCGKTSCIKAIANHLNRHIVSINLSHIQNISELRNMFLDEEVLLLDNMDGNQYRVVASKRIYVFEEIDCNSKNNILLDRTLVDLNTTPTDDNAETSAELLASVLTDTFKKDGAKKQGSGNTNKNKHTLTLGEILELLDGISESSDRVCIFTTNYPDKLDKALLRPGRIDLLIEFKKLRAIDIKNLYKLWFNLEIPINQYKQIPDNAISQAEFGKLCFQYKHSGKPKELIEHIIREYSLKQ